MPSLTVQSGPFRFSTKAELDAIRLQFRTAAASFNSGLVGSSINGQSFTFTLAGVTYTREEFGDHLAAAYNQLGIYDYGTPTPVKTTSRF